VQLETLLVSQPNNGEEAMQITEMLVKSNSVDVIIIDSVAALVRLMSNRVASTQA